MFTAGQTLHYAAAGKARAHKHSPRRAYRATLTRRQYRAAITAPRPILSGRHFLKIVERAARTR